MRHPVITMLSLLSLLVFAPMTLAETAEELCTELTRKAPALAEQFPIEVDKVTSWSGLSAEYVSNECLLKFSFAITAQALAEELAKLQGTEAAELLALFQSEELGAEVLVGFFTPSAEDTAAGLLSEYGTPASVKVHVIYEFDDPKIADVIIIGADTTQ